MGSQDQTRHFLPAPLVRSRAMWIAQAQKAGFLQLDVAAGATPTVPGNDVLRHQERVPGGRPRMGCGHCWLREQEGPDLSRTRYQRPAQAPRTARHQRHVCWTRPAEVTMSAFDITETSEERRP